MNNDYNTCDIVFELLPLYIEQKTGEESNSFINEHLAGCQECQKVYLLMNTEFSIQIKNATDKQITKKKKRRFHLTPTTKRICILVAGLIGYLCLMVGIVIYTLGYLTGV